MASNTQIQEIKYISQPGYEKYSSVFEALKLLFRNDVESGVMLYGFYWVPGQLELQWSNWKNCLLDWEFPNDW